MRDQQGSSAAEKSNHANCKNLTKNLVADGFSSFPNFLDYCTTRSLYQCMIIYQFVDIWYVYPVFSMFSMPSPSTRPQCVFEELSSALHSNLKLIRSLSSFHLTFVTSPWSSPSSLSGTQQYPGWCSRCGGPASGPPCSRTWRRKRACWPVALPTAAWRGRPGQGRGAAGELRYLEHPGAMHRPFQQLGIPWFTRKVRLAVTCTGVELL